MTTVSQLFEILQKYNRMDLLHVYSDIAIKENYVTLTSKCPSSKDDKLSFQYFFYHHLDQNFPKAETMKAIDDKDFDTFKHIYAKWEYTNNLVYLPDFIFIRNESRDMEFGEVSGIWLKEIFELIDVADYECG